jgi:dCMP deaminase
VENIASQATSWDEIYLFKAFIMATQSHCQSRQAAAIIVKDGREIATGINGTVAGIINCDQIFPSKTSADWNRDAHHKFQLVNGIHAEMNAIAYAAKNGIAIGGTTLYCTTEPCNDCLKTIMAAGIKRVIYAEKYNYAARDKCVEATLKQLGIKLEHLPIKMKFEIDASKQK